MDSLIEMLYYGKIKPVDSIDLNDNEYRKIRDKVLKEEENWINSLVSEEVVERFLNLESLYTELTDIEIKHSFIEGFKLGLVMTAEAFIKK